jgi:hypothetical protein
MKILQIVPSISLVYGGPSQMVLGLSAALAQLGQEVTIITTDSNGDTGQAPLDLPFAATNFLLICLLGWLIGQKITISPIFTPYSRQ